MKKISLVALFCMHLFAAHAQTPTTNINATKGVEQVNYLNLQTEQQLNNIKNSADLETAENTNAKALSIARSIQYDKGIGEALYNKGNIVLKLEDPQKQQKSLKIFHEALPYLKKDKTSDKLALCLHKISFCYHHMGKLNEAIAYIDSTEKIYLQLKDTIAFIIIYAFRGHCYFDKGDYKTAYELGMDALKKAQRKGDTASNVYALTHMANLFLGAGLPTRTLQYVNDILHFYPGTLSRSEKLHPSLVWPLIIGAESYLKMNNVDSAFHITRIIPEDNSDYDYPLLYGRLYVAQKQYDKALEYFRRGLHATRMAGLEISNSRYANQMGLTHLMLNRIDSATIHAKNALQTAEAIPALLEMKNAVSTLTDIYARQKNYERVYYYGQRYKALNDSLAPEEYRQKLALVQVQNELETQRQQALLFAQQNKIKEQQLNKEGMMKNFLLAGMGFLLLFVSFIVRSNRKQHKANLLLNKQKEEVQKALTDLGTAQDQLIQREKMASLGELTAGIAHEIQNPLNFINNFSEVNTELVEELQDELATGRTNEVKEISDVLRENNIKILHHGKRASAIVKNMLQHSRGGSGKKEPTDINALVDECLNLSYHGLRAKDKSFNATLETDFDESIGNINIIPQDVGRVILNLITNAFYAVAEKKKLHEDNYEPTVSVNTKNSGDRVLISVKDNGNGIQKKVLDKIFQPFFTTKPTGQGTGLGLSLSYDIVKAHDGEIKVETKEGEGTKFIIILKR